MQESGTFLALFLGIAFDVVNAWEPPPYGSVGTNQCLTNRLTNRLNHNCYLPVLVQKLDCIPFGLYIFDKT